MKSSKTSIFIFISFHLFCLFSYLFYLLMIFSYYLSHHNRLFSFTFLGFLNVSVWLVISSFIFGFIIFSQVILFVFVKVIILSFLIHLHPFRIFLVSMLILFYLKIIKRKSTFFIINNDSFTINFSVIGFFISMNKILFAVKFNKSISSRFAILVFNYTYLFNDTIFLEKMKNNLPQIQTSMFFMLSRNLILQLREFFMDLNRFYHLKMDSILQFMHEFYFRLILSFIKQYEIFFVILFQVFMIPSTLSWELKTFPSS